MSCSHLLKDGIIFFSDKTENKAWPTCSTRSPCSVKVIWSWFWEVKVDNVAHKWKVQATRCQISGYQNVCLLIPKLFVIVWTHSWWDLSVQASRFLSFFRQCVLDCAGRLNRIAENDAWCLILSGVLSELLHKNLQRLEFVEVCKLYKLMLKVT